MIANCWKILGILPTESLETLKIAFHKQAKKLHPDKDLTPGATERFQELERAYVRLENELSFHVIKRTRLESTTDMRNKVNRSKKTEDEIARESSKWCPETEDQVNAIENIKVFVYRNIWYRRSKYDKFSNFLMRHEFNPFEKYEWQGPPTFADFMNALQKEIAHWFLRSRFLKPIAFKTLQHLLTTFICLHPSPAAQKFAKTHIQELNTLRDMGIKDHRNASVRTFRKNVGVCNGVFAHEFSLKV